MGDEGPPRKRRFHPPVAAPFLGDPTAVPALVDGLASLPPGALGSAATVSGAGTESRPADPSWSSRVLLNGGRRSAVRAAPRAPATQGAIATRGRARCDKRPRPLPQGPAPELDDGDGVGGGGDDTLSFARGTPRRDSSRRAPSAPSDARMTEALSACVRRACGLPSSTPIGRRASTVSAVTVGDPASRSRAILVRVGWGKADAAVLWSSHRGGILCSCFAGTQNALFLSASSRSCVCKHTTSLRLCLSKNGISLAKFWQRMHLGSAPADFVCRQQYGPLRFWVVLYRSVYSLVWFTAANVATCIAPSCRRFRARCGHVVLARPFNAEARVVDADEAAQDPSATVAKPKPAVTVDGPSETRGPADEDAGIELEPGDTERASSDAAEAAVSARVRRNLLPCLGEVKAGEVWARTAEWRGLFTRRCSNEGGDSRASDLAVISNIMDGCVGLGLIHPRTYVPVERYCGSCGRMREDRHIIVKERAILYTHHPTAPAIEVCWPFLCSLVSTTLHVPTVKLVLLMLSLVGRLPTNYPCLTVCYAATVL